MEDDKRLVRMFVEKLWNERKLELADTILMKTVIHTNYNQVQSQHSNDNDTPHPGRRRLSRT